MSMNNSFITPNMPGIQGAVPMDQFFIEKLEYIPAGTYQPMPLRPYTFSPTSEAINTISERMERHKLGKVSTGILSGITHGIMSSAAVGFESAVNHNWLQVPRFAFFMKVRRIDAIGMEEMYYIFGYTDREGVNRATGVTDPDMVFFINNIITTGAYTIQTPMGLQRQEKLLSHYNTIFSNGPDLYTQRPLDLFETLSAQQTAMYIGLPSGQSARSQVGPYTNNTVSSAVDNNIPTEYLSKILTSGMQVNTLKEVHVNSYNVEKDDRTSRYFAEESMMANSFVRLINRNAGFNDARPTFMFRDLLTVDPGVIQRDHLWDVTDLYTNPVMQATPSVGEHWHGQDPDTVKAHAIIEPTVALATKLGFTKLSFKATNKSTPMAEIVVGLLDWTSFLEIDQQSFYVLCEHFKQTFTEQIFLNETEMGRQPLFVEIHVDLLRSSKIYIEYAYNYGVWYTLPTFANSNFASVLTNNNNMVVDAAVQLNNVIDQITPRSSMQMGINTYHPGF